MSTIVKGTRLYIVFGSPTPPENSQFVLTHGVVARTVSRFSIHGKSLTLADDSGDFSQVPEDDCALTPMGAYLKRRECLSLFPSRVEALDKWWASRPGSVDTPSPDDAMEVSE